MPSRIPALPALSVLLALAAPGVEAQVRLSEVLYDPMGADTGHQSIEIRNLDPDDPAAIGNFWLSFKPASWKFPADAVIPPGGTVVVRVNAAGTSNLSEFFTGTSGMRSLRREDAVSLFNTNLFSDPTKLIDFVEWGAPRQAGEEVAVQAFRWNFADPVPVAALREGSSIAYKGSGSFASSWCVDGSPTVGANNDGCTPSRARSPVQINEVLPGPGSLVELKNTGTVLEVLEGKRLLARDASFAFPPETVLAPGELLLVRLGVAGVDGPGELHTGPAFRDLDPADSLGFYAGTAGADATLIIDFLQWGSAGQPYEDHAVEAGLWGAGEAVDVSVLARGGSLSAREEASQLARWMVDNTPTPGAENGQPYSSPVLINEVLVLPAGGGPQAVEVLNRSESDLDLSGWALCTRSAVDVGAADCATFPAGTVLAGGEVLVAVLAAEAVPPALALPLPAMDIAGGELALLVHPGQDLPGNYLDYFRWGNSEPVMEEAAVEAGLWQAGESFNAAAATEGTSLAYGGSGRGPASFRLDDTPSLGQPNAERPPERDFVRADCNQDGSTDLSDAISTFALLFLGEEAPACRDACDSNDDGGLDISDPIFTLGSLFLGGSPPRPPLTCGPDETPDGVYCESFRDC